ncbi:MAG: hypothetical protein Q7U04_13720 [Bacteriovorax sp.]|nr:hypothetical protein [Bacteriovorax sp.]
MDWNTFWIGFLPNFVASILTGIIFSIVIAVWIGNLLNDKERKKTKLDETLQYLDNADKYYSVLKSEIETTNRTILERLPEIELDYFLQGGFFVFDNPFWEIMVNSGELPKYLQTRIVQKTSKYFLLLNVATRLEERINQLNVNARNNPVLPVIINDKLLPTIELLKSNLSRMYGLGEEVLDEMQREMANVQKLISEKKSELGKIT